MQEPLPNVNKAYAMLLIVESQRLVQRNFKEYLDIAALMVKTQNVGKGSNSKNVHKKKE